MNKKELMAMVGVSTEGLVEGSQQTVANYRRQVEGNQLLLNGGRLLCE